MLFLTVVDETAADVVKLVNKVDSAVVVLKTAGRSLDVTNGKVKEVAAKGLGTGVLGDNAGPVVTAAHVVQTADKVVAEFADGTESEVRIVACDPALDLALLLIEKVANSSKVVRLGDSDKLKLGEEIVVIDSLFGLSHSVSTGIVSGKHQPDTDLAGLGAVALEII